MFKKDDKRRLYWLIDNYLLEKITARFFCDEFYYSYDLELDEDLFDNIEKELFEELSKVSSRFSEFSKDHSECSEAFSTEKELKEKIVEIKGRLIDRQDIS